MRLLILSLFSLASTVILAPVYSFAQQNQQTVAQHSGQNSAQQNNSALSSEMKVKYESFNTEYDKVFKLAENKAEFTKRFSVVLTEVKKIYAEFETLEKTDLTAEGNQMALDIEMLEPLVVLSQAFTSTTSSKTSSAKSACNEASDLNDLNATSDEVTYVRIQKALRSLCK